MAKGKQFHVVPRAGAWAVRRDGADRVSATAQTQAQAIKLGRDMSIRNSGELFIHRPDGRIRDRDSHGNDPHPPKG